MMTGQAAAAADLANERPPDDEALDNAMVGLLNAVMVFDSHGNLVCKCCQMVNEHHSEDCPVPFLEEWINPLSF